MKRPHVLTAILSLRIDALAFAAVLMGLAAGDARTASVTICRDDTIPQIVFASEEIESALKERGHRVNQAASSALESARQPFRIVLERKTDRKIADRLQSAGAAPIPPLEDQGFAIRKSSTEDCTTFWVVGADAAGAMYGGMELAETVRLDGLEGIEDVVQNPYLAMRGVKFNCPLDFRTPSYSDVCDAAQQNILEMWNFDFWRRYLDQLARSRYNFVSLWNLHPFPSMVKVPEYPEVALDDVQRSTVPWKEYYSLTGTGFDAPEILGSVETLKVMPIEEKIEFWRRVMRYARDRNIHFYIVTWNIFVYGTGGKYGITDDLHNPTTRDYFRKSVAQMFLTYPDLAGIGLTTGENMPKATRSEKEEWAFQTYAQGVLDAARVQPQRNFTLIHRQHQSGVGDIARQFAPLIDHPRIDFLFSFKYAQAHVYSSTRQPFADRFVADLKEHGGVKTIWTLRNDDVYHFRWGAPDFVREFLTNLPRDVSQGFYFGSDQYIWGREFLSTEPESPRQLEIDKHWYHWMLWGRLGYDPTLSNRRFERILERRFPSIAADKLFTAWQEASLVYPKVTGFHWGALDFQWYIEACKSSPGPANTQSGFHDVNRFITLPPHPGTDCVSIPDYVEGVVSGQPPSGTTPPELVRQIHGHADKALRLLGGLRDGGNKELRLTLGDIRAIAYLGKYYAHKIDGATRLALYRSSGDPKHRDAAVAELTEAAGYWDLYTAAAQQQYKNPLWTNRVGYCDWQRLREEVFKDIRIAGDSGR